MSVLFNRSARGIRSPIPWYKQREGQRFFRDQMLLKETYPTFEWTVDEELQKIILEGILTIKGPANVPYSVALSIKFPDTYPNTLPKVFDPIGRFPPDLDRHVLSDGSFCLWLPIDLPLNLERGNTIVDFLDHVALFLERQLIYEVTGLWPGKAWAHGTEAFIDYIGEHLGGSELIEIFGAVLSGIIKVGRNDRCLCGSGKKYKHCHLEKVEYVQRHIRVDYLKEFLHTHVV